MSEVKTQKGLEAFLLKGADILRGHMDNADFKQYIFPILFLKRLSDIWDQEYALTIKQYPGENPLLFDENFRFSIPSDCHWNNLKNSFADIGILITKSMRGIEDSNPELLGIFGDTVWTNKDRLPDKMLRTLIEHFSSVILNSESVTVDQMSTAYEYLVRVFANDGGQTAKEFYTNRTVVDLMVRILKPTPNSTIYDPTCGTGGMLLNCVNRVEADSGMGKTLKLYGQELNVTTSAIARMNLYIHAVNNFEIYRNDTLSDPGFIHNGKLKQFDIVLANPPYSISNWNRVAWQTDKYGRNKHGGLPPQGCADYAFIQHIIASMKSDGRAAILLPHGSLIRDEEQSIRKYLIENDYIEAIIGLGPNLFYNSTMESVIMVLSRDKSENLSNRVLLIDGHELVERKEAMSYLTENHISTISDLYITPNDTEISKIVNLSDMKKNQWKLNLGNYIPSSKWKEFFSDDENKIESKISITKEMVNNLEKITTLKQEREALYSNSSQWPKRKLSNLLGAYKGGKTEVNPTVAVSLEHLSSEQTHLENWADPSEFSFSRKFSKDCILFGRRRSYLRKVVLSNISGVCSGDIIAFECISDETTLDYMLWVLKSEPFTQFSLKHSAGGFSPRVRVDTLYDYQFNLPPIEIQKQITDISYKISQAYKKLKIDIDDMHKNIEKEFFSIFSEGAE